MFVGNFEKIVAIKFAQRMCCLIEYKLDKFVPPIFVVIFARSIDRDAAWHSFPGNVERAIELLRIKCQTHLVADQRIMIADRLGEIKERSEERRVGKEAR